LSHLSLKAPSTPALARLTATYRQARNRRRRAAFVGCPSAAAGLTFALWGFWPKPKPVPVAPPGSPLVAAPVIPPPVSETPKPAVRTGKVRFQVPESVTVYWDGRKVEPKAGLAGVTLGVHWLLLEREGFDPIRSKVQVRAEQPTLIKVD
jgi:hypothetical protein